MPRSSGSQPPSERAALTAGLKIIAVTGTNGKTSTTSMLSCIVAAAGQVPVRVTTLGMWVGDEQVADDGSMPSFVRTLECARAAGARTLALEVTSRALEGGFARRFPPHVAVFTNLTRDHLDRHGTPERYLAAKAQLFVHLRRAGVAVLNAADPASALLREVLSPEVEARGFHPAPDRAPRDAPTAEPGELPIALAAARVDADQAAVRVALEDSPLARRLGGALRLAVPGTFQADNALAAAVAADAAGFDAAAITAGLASFAGVAGRFEVCAQEPLVVVDFAHTPDALRRVLVSARQLALRRGGRLGCVFGCGGERDREKRPVMGELADRLADAVWLTTDNPRSEAPEAIAAQVRSGAAGRADWVEIADRGEAIAAAVRWASPQDVLVVAGRGHEALQQLTTGPAPFSDKQAIVRALKR